MQTHSEIVRRALARLFYQKTLVLRTVGVFLVVLAGLYVLSPRIYVGNFAVLVRAPDLDTSRILPNTGVYMTQPFMNAEFLANEIEVMTSDRVLGKVLDAVRADDPGFSPGLFANGPSWLVRPIAALVRGLKESLGSGSEETPLARAAALRADIQGLRDLIAVTPLQGTHVLDVQVRFFDPDLLLKLQRALLDTYLGERGALLAANDAAEVYLQDADQQRESWERQARAIVAFRNANNLHAYEARRTQLVDSIAAKEREIRDLDANTREIDAQLEQIAAGVSPLAVRPSATEENRILGVLASDIAANETRLVQFPSGSPRARDLRQDIAGLYAKYAATLRQYLDGRRETDRNRIGVVTMERDSLNQEIALLTTSYQVLENMEQEADVAREAYQSFLRKVQEIRVQNILRVHSNGSVSVVRAPFVDGRAVWPSLLILLPLFLVVSTFLGVMFAYVKSLFDDDIIDPSELSFTGVPVYGSLRDG